MTKAIKCFKVVLKVVVFLVKHKDEIIAEVRDDQKLLMQMIEEIKKLCK